MIFYFSGTGNTRWVARQIADAIGEELLYIPDLIKERRYEFQVREDERIGFCFPTLGWQPPRIVRDFIGKLVLSGYEDAFRMQIHYIQSSCPNRMSAYRSCTRILRKKLPERLPMPKSNCQILSLPYGIAERVSCHLRRAPPHAFTLM